MTKKKPNQDSVDIFYGMVPPQNKELEKVIIGIVLLESSAFATIQQYLFKDAFYRIEHQHVFDAFQRLFDQNKPIDILTVKEELEKMGKLDEVGGAYGIVQFTNNVTSSAHLEEWCKELLEHYLKRKGIEIGGTLLNDCFAPEKDAFEIFNKADNQIINEQEKVLRGQIQDVSGFCRQVYEQYESVKQSGVLGIRTGISSFDSAMSGLVAPDLLIVAARPGQGKTAWALSITKNVTIDQKIAGAWFSLEMDGVQLCRRLTSMISGISHTDIRNGKVPPHEEDKFYKVLDEVSRAPLYIEDKPSINIRDMRARAIILKRKYDIKYVVVDYLQLMSGVDVRNKNRTEVVGEISRGLKTLAKELQIPVVALCQLSRTVETRGDKIPQLSDLRESGSIEQDADSVLFLMRPEYYGIMNTYDIDGIEYSPNSFCLGVIGKNRHGSTKNIPFAWDGRTMTMGSHYGGVSQNFLPEPQNNFAPAYNNPQPQYVNNNNWDGELPTSQDLF